MRGAPPPHAVRHRLSSSVYWRGALELLDEFSTWFLQYFFMSLLDMPELLAFCCAMHSFICSLLAAWSLLAILLLLVLLLVLDGDVEDGVVELGYWSWLCMEPDCAALCAIAMPAALRITNANAPVTRFTGPSFGVFR
jgi:hypothetical protein